MDGHIKLVKSDSKDFYCNSISNYVLWDFYSSKNPENTSWFLQIIMHNKTGVLFAKNSALPSGINHILNFPVI